MLDDYQLHDKPSHRVLVPQYHYESLDKLNLEDELLALYTKCKNTLAAFELDEETPANQLAQLMNTMKSVLSDIAKTRTELYNAERIKLMEACLISALKSTPQEVQDAFMSAYSTLAKKNDLQ